jgi:hypothetical protein
MLTSRVETGATYILLLFKTSIKFTLSFIRADYHTLQTATWHSHLAGDVCEA